ITALGIGLSSWYAGDWENSLTMAGVLLAGCFGLRTALLAGFVGLRTAFTTGWQWSMFSNLLRGSPDEPGVLHVRDGKIQLNFQIASDLSIRKKAVLYPLAVLIVLAGGMHETIHKFIPSEPLTYALEAAIILLVVGLFQFLWVPSLMGLAILSLILMRDSNALGEAKRDEKMKREILDMLIDALEKNYIHAGEKSDLEEEIAAISQSVPEFLEAIKLFLVFREKIKSNVGTVGFYYDTWLTDAEKIDLGGGFQWICIGDKPALIARQQPWEKYYYEIILKNGELFAYGTTTIIEQDDQPNYALLRFRVLDDFIDESRANNYAEVIFKKRLTILKKIFPQIQEFRVPNDQIINPVSKKALAMDTFVFLVRKIGFKPVRVDEVLSEKILEQVRNRQVMDESDLRRLLSGFSSYLSLLADSTTIESERRQDEISESPFLNRGLRTEAKRDKKMKREILNMLIDALEKNYIHAGEKRDLEEEIAATSQPASEILETLKLFLLFREKMMTKVRFARYINDAWLTNAQMIDLGQGFQWICMGNKPASIAKKQPWAKYYYEIILKEGELFAYGTTTIMEKLDRPVYALLAFRVLDDFIEISREKNLAEIVVKKRLEVLKKNHPQIQEFRILPSQIFNTVEKIPTVADTFIFWVKKIGFKPKKAGDEILEQIQQKQNIQESDLMFLNTINNYLFISADKFSGEKKDADEAKKSFPGGIWNWLKTPVGSESNSLIWRVNPWFHRIPGWLSMVLMTGAIIFSVSQTWAEKIQGLQIQPAASWSTKAVNQRLKEIKRSHLAAHHATASKFNPDSFEIRELTPEVGHWNYLSGWVRGYHTQPVQKGTKFNKTMVYLPGNVLAVFMTLSAPGKAKGLLEARLLRQAERRIARIFDYQRGSYSGKIKRGLITLKLRLGRYDQLLLPAEPREEKWSRGVRYQDYSQALKSGSLPLDMGTLLMLLERYMNEAALWTGNIESAFLVRENLLQDLDPYSRPDIQALLETAREDQGLVGVMLKEAEKCLNGGAQSLTVNNILAALLQILQTQVDPQKQVGRQAGLRPSALNPRFTGLQILKLEDSASAMLEEVEVILAHLPKTIQTAGLSERLMALQYVLKTVKETEAENSLVSIAHEKHASLLAGEIESLQAKDQTGLVEIGEDFNSRIGAVKFSSGQALKLGNLKFYWPHVVEVEGPTDRMKAVAQGLIREGKRAEGLYLSLFDGRRDRLRDNLSPARLTNMEHMLIKFAACLPGKLKALIVSRIANAKPIACSQLMLEQSGSRLGNSRLALEMKRKDSALHKGLLRLADTRLRDEKNFARSQLSLTLSMIRFLKKNLGNFDNSEELAAHLQDLEFFSEFFRRVPFVETIAIAKPDPFAPALSERKIPALVVPVVLLSQRGPLGTLTMMLEPERIPYMLDDNVLEMFELRIRRLSEGSA
ncbi:hypothetical protein KAR10_04185, partial [bacterium]|nr:hypothetical protein [bacterium]